MSSVASLYVVTNAISVPQLDLNAFGSSESLIQACHKLKSAKRFLMASINFRISLYRVHTEQ